MSDLNRDTLRELPVSAQPPALDIAAVRSRLRDTRGPEYWRSLEEVAQTQEFEELLRQEFPQHAAVWDEDLSRRRFLQLAGASLALAGLTSCGYQPPEKIVPYVKQPEQIVPGKPLYFASAFTLSGYADGILVENHMGRPTKIEGNPDHPSSLGATSALAQASILSLYDPDRSQAIRNLGRILTWPSFRETLDNLMRAQRALAGDGLRVLTTSVSSPTLARQLDLLLEQLPGARWYQYEPAARQNVREGARLAFGESVETRYDLQQADVIVTLDADLLGSMPGHLRYARDFAARRKMTADTVRMNRLYSIESMPTVTGSIADNRLPLRASDIEALVLALAARVNVPGASAPNLQPKSRRWLDSMAEDLAAHRGRSLVVAGDHAAPEIHAIVHAINQALGNDGRTIRHTAPVCVEPREDRASIAELVNEMRSGRVDALFIIGGNPVYDAPADLDVAGAMESVKTRVHLGIYDDETSELCQWHIPMTHPLESWSDARAHDGTATIVQPLMAPLYDGHSPLELLAAMIEQPDSAPEPSPYESVRETWRRHLGADDAAFETFWRRSLHDGVIAGTALPARRMVLRRAQVQRAAVTVASRLRSSADGVELNLRLDPSIHDGSYANNGWLQELPKPWTRLTWDNALLVSPRTAEELDLANEEVVEIAATDQGGAAKVEAPVWILPGHADRAATLHLGFGRRLGGKVADGAGVDAYPLSTSEHRWLVPNVSLRKTGARARLACTQDHWSMEGRPLYRSATLEEYRQHPDFAHAHEHHTGDLSMFPPHPYDGYAWGLSIDLSSCIGCNACVVACNAENNIPVVGKDQVLKAREMHWLRIDRYFEGHIDDPKLAQQPVMCMHCENAPCEQVCPVAATVHSAEGLNDMVYNRCVGTRYCSNNCPYKVRRFNFLQYTDNHSPSLKLMRNPDVTVRSRGVMEKCTYCVQRISHARITAKTEGRKIRDGDIHTACQQACPTQAIVFGDVNDPESRVSKLKAAPLDYRILTELNTKPRTSYLASVRNPNPDLVETTAAHEEHHERS